jgi:hypothetical protein
MVPTLERFIDTVRTYRDTKLVVDSSRYTFLEQTHNVLVRIQTGTLRGANRFRQLLLGEKSTGKTTLLESLRDSVLTLFPDIECVHIRCDTLNNTLIQALVKELNIEPAPSDYEICDSIDYIHERLTERNKGVLLLLDEFHLVYSMTPEIGEHIIREMGALAGSTAPIHCIVTGGGLELESLAYATYSIQSEEAKHFPSYTGHDLNWTKLQPWRIEPLGDYYETSETEHANMISVLVSN